MGQPRGTGVPPRKCPGSGIGAAGHRGKISPGRGSPQVEVDAPQEHAEIGHLSLVHIEDGARVEFRVEGDPCVHALHLAPELDDLVPAGGRLGNAKRLAGVSVTGW